MDDDDNQNVDIFANNKITISVPCMQSYKALLWWYTENKIILDPDDFTVENDDEENETVDIFANN